MNRRRITQGLVLLLGASLLQACATSSKMDTYVPAQCHGVAEPFASYTLELQKVPGFIEGVIATSLRGALAAQGLDEAAEPVRADVKVISVFHLIDRNPRPPGGDPFGEQVQTSGINRFVTHLEVDVVDQRSGSLIWTGAMYRTHAIEGGETFHDERAVLIIRQAFDEMFVGLTSSCE